MDINKLEELFNDGYLIKQIHPIFPLTIWNYSQKTQYEGYWNEYTLKCRGLIIDNETGDIIAQPFPKFFNIEENKHTPTEEFEVFEKMDGSLGILFYYKNQWIFSSRGSFTSEQAIKGRELLQKYDINSLYKHITYCFEIIYPENRIVVDYKGEEKLVMLGSFVPNGLEVDVEFWRRFGFEVVSKYNGISDYTQLKNKIDDNAEGFVIRFTNGDRCKIKGKEYIRLHNIMTNISTTSIWSCLKNNDNFEDIIKNVPDEFFNKIQDYITELENKYKLIEYQSEYCFKVERINCNTKKDFALKIKTHKYSPILFRMWEGLEYSHIIWDLIKPKFEKI